VVPERARITLKGCGGCLKRTACRGAIHSRDTARVLRMTRSTWVGLGVNRNPDGCNSKQPSNTPRERLQFGKPDRPRPDDSGAARQDACQSDRVPVALMLRLGASLMTKASLATIIAGAGEGVLHGENHGGDGLIGDARFPGRANGIVVDYNVARLLQRCRGAVLLRRQPIRCRESDRRQGHHRPRRTFVCDIPGGRRPEAGRPPSRRI